MDEDLLKNAQDSMKNTKDAVERLFSEYAWMWLMVQQKWIPCKKLLPPKDKFLRVIYCGGAGTVGDCFYWNGFNRSPGDNGEFAFKDVVAWMPAPVPYDEESEDQ